MPAFIAEPEPEPPAFAIPAPEALPPFPPIEPSPTVMQVDAAEIAMPLPPPPPPESPGNRSGRLSLPLVPPPPRDVPIRVGSPEDFSAVPSLPIDEPPAPSAPPSREDLAALDALLGTPGRRSSPSLQPLQRTNNDWEPSLSTLSGGGRRRDQESRGGKPVLVGLMVLVVVGAVGAGGWLYFTQGGLGALRPGAEPAETAAPAAGSPPTDTPDTPPPVNPIVNATSAPTTAPTAEPTTPVVASRTEAPRTPQSPGGNDARTLLRGGQYSEAATAFASQLRRASGFTIQLLVACSDDTVRKAASAVSQDELYIVPVDYKGKRCYRMGWGLYEGEARATSALRSLPGYFHQPGVVPRVVPTSAFLR
jgi:hypothetical protein